MVADDDERSALASGGSELGQRRVAVVGVEHDRVRCCTGGDTRAASVAAGIAALGAGPDDWVLVHDAARPCLPLDALDLLIDRVSGSGVGGLLAQPQSDTLKRADASGRVLETLPREGLWRAQTPQMFRVGELGAALAAAQEDGVTVTDEAQAMERAGHPVQVIGGPACNIKVTYAGDLAIAASWLAAPGVQSESGAELAP